VSGEEVSYQYDELGRLMAAATTGPEWGLSWAYDGFGNRLAQNGTKGTAPVVSLSISAATNRITTPGFAYDAGGNLVQWPGGTVTIGAKYDVDGRLSVVRWDGVERERYYYDARNLRVKRGFFYQVYGLGGEPLGEYQASAGSVVPQMWRERVYFAGRLMATMEQDGTTAEANTDRLGSLRAARRYPFGEGTNADNDEFATYRKDTSTQHDYAWHRYYSATWGRFSSPDPYQNGARATNPQSWNAYSYVENDPVNSMDPTGLTRLTAEYCQWFGWQDWECGNSDMTRVAESGGSARAGGWNPCPAGPGFLPNPSCMLPLIPIALPPPSKGGGAEIECEIQVKYRPVSVPGVNAVHVYLWMNDGVNQWVAEGRPEYLDPIEIVSFVPMPGGGLVPVITVTWGRLQGLLEPEPGLQGNAPGQDKKHGPTLRGPFWCGAFSAIKTATRTYNDRQVEYWPSGPNSNSYAHWLLIQAGLAAVFRTAPPGAVGWDNPLWP